MVSWRDTVKIWPAAELLPMLSKDEATELRENIRKNGLCVAVVTYIKDGTEWLLDGRNRLDQMEAIGMTVVDGKGRIKSTYKGKSPATGFTEKQIDDWVIATNIVRRQLSMEQRREFLKKLMKSDPTKSDRKFATLSGMSAPVVGSMRKKLEAAGEIEKNANNVQTRTAKALRDNPDKSSKQIAKLVGCSAAMVRKTRRRLEGCSDIKKLDKIAGCDGKTYTRKPNNEPPKPEKPKPEKPKISPEEKTAQRALSMLDSIDLHKLPTALTDQIKATTAKLPTSPQVVPPEEVEARRTLKKLELAREAHITAVAAAGVNRPAEIKWMMDHLLKTTDEWGEVINSIEMTTLKLRRK
jgi:hypothetical protein